jgi:hypothetical protein
MNKSTKKPINEIFDLSKPSELIRLSELLWSQVRSDPLMAKAALDTIADDSSRTVLFTAAWLMGASYALAELAKGTLRPVEGENLTWQKN